MRVFLWMAFGFLIHSTIQPGLTGEPPAPGTQPPRPEPPRRPRLVLVAHGSKKGGNQYERWFAAILPSVSSMYGEQLPRQIKFGDTPPATGSQPWATTRGVVTLSIRFCSA